MKEHTEGDDSDSGHAWSMRIPATLRREGGMTIGSEDVMVLPRRDEVVTVASLAKRVR